MCHLSRLHNFHPTQLMCSEKIQTYGDSGQLEMMQSGLWIKDQVAQDLVLGKMGKILITFCQVMIDCRSCITMQVPINMQIYSYNPEISDGIMCCTL